ncbi:hypothetical protein [Polaromonas sp.]|uniref:hypothetical protein n=1 Tax=Polaromonas sp. TaxID=1869339 RepID=UPI00286B02F7|nr:hypothetical protein [Polaromonas sp.]
MLLPHTPSNHGFYLGRHAADQFAVGVNEGLLGFDLGDDGALGGEVGEWKRIRLEIAAVKTLHGHACTPCGVALNASRR